MQIVAEKRVLEITETGVGTTKTAYLVEPSETVEALLMRVGVDGKSLWHFDQIEVRLKLVRSPE